MQGGKVQQDSNKNLDSHQDKTKLENPNLDSTSNTNQSTTAKKEPIYLQLTLPEEDSSNTRDSQIKIKITAKPQNPTQNSQTHNNDKQYEDIDSIMLDNIKENKHFYNKKDSARKNKKQNTQKSIRKAQSVHTNDEENLSEQAKIFKAWRLFLVLSVFAVCFVIFLLSVYAKIITIPPTMNPYNKQARNYPWSSKADIDIALRGQITSADDYILASSKKLYTISVYVPSIYEEKREVLVNLLNLYAGFDTNLIRESLAKGRNVLIADDVSAIDAANLKILNYKLAQLGVYKKCVFTYINKTNMQDSEFKTMIAHAQITHDKGRQTPLDNTILKTIKDFEENNITESQAIYQLNTALVEYKNKNIDFSKECYTPIFAYNPDVRNNASIKIDRGLDIAVSRIEREYPFQNIMQPLLGFTNYGKKNIDNKSYDDTLKLIAQSGVEKYRDGILSAKRDGKIIGQADKGGNIVFNKHSRIIPKEDGFDIKLTIPLTLQSKIQTILEKANLHYKAQQIVAGIMNPNTGEIITLASSQSFNPNIGERDKDIAKKMSVAVAERSFEPGSTIKPLVFSYLMNKKMINFKESIDLHNGIYQLRTYTIRDSVPLKSATPEQILIKSSNIGMTKLTKSLSGNAMQNLFKTFGVGEITGVDIANEATGLLPTTSKLNREVEKGTASYGYGLRMTFIQLLRSYATFNNGGFLVTPHVVQQFISPQDKIFYPSLEAPKQIISKENAEYMQKLLHRVVKEGTAKRADVKGLIIGGKTGTAREHINKETIYNGSFFGYASDGKRTYTIGVVTYGSQANEDYYAGQTAAPVFAEIVELLAQENYLEKRQE